MSLCSVLASNPVTAADLDDLWHGNSTIAFSKSNGNTNSSILSSNVDLSKASVIDKWSVYVASTYGKSQGVTNNDKARGGVRYDHNLSVNTFGFGLGELERDGIAKLTLRSTVGTGLGHHVIQDSDTTFDILAGWAYTRSNFQGGIIKNTAELLTGEESTHQLSETVQFKQKLSLYTNLRASGIFESSVVVALTKNIGLSVGWHYKYNTDVQPGVKRSDTMLLTGLNYRF
jgi:putative salt-induced outer membrane protein